ncbi:hypothetical protein GCM10009765_39250 [Fodinicola feengrottensis]|uniref:FTP domain-containing protein n=1 Tax=Fodinicola feengrottensis TaxID=435914 RepID=A0ABN2HDG0_9ACTN
MAAGQLTSYDVRDGGSQAQTEALAQRQLALRAAPAVRELSQQLGPQSIVDLDPLTGTPRQIARLDGMLTGPSRAAAKDVALGYVRDHSAVFHLSAADLRNLAVARDYVDITGIHHLSFVQRAGGLDLFGNGLKANVSKDGRLINLTGSPLPALTAPAAGPAISADQAIQAAKRDTAEKNVVRGPADTSTPVLFRTPGGTRRAYETVTMSAVNPTLDVVDAQNGRVLYRQPLSSDYANSAGSPVSGGPEKMPAAQPAAATQYGDVVTYYPGAPHGGDLHTVSLNQNGWLPKGSAVLFGNNAHAYADLNDNAQADSNEEVGPTGQQGYRFPLVRTHPAGEPCDTNVCTWDPSTAYSWQNNVGHDTVQAFYFANVWHDHLQDAPIGFTEAAGNFQQVNSSGQGIGGDPMHTQALDGASVANGLPDANRIDNARIATPPDGQSAIIQMYLYHLPGAAYPSGDPFLAVDSTNEADSTYHEYTNALPQRLLVDANNAPVLNSWQGRAMQVGWSYWYPADYEVSHGDQIDTPAPGELKDGAYETAGGTFVHEGYDCPVGTAEAACPGTVRTGPGGFTYGQISKVSTTPNPHGGGEFWAQTLWDLRTALGSTLAESLVTRAMELSPAFPSMVDMRNSILQADQAIYGGRQVAALWRLFAARGLGFFAASDGGDDQNPVQSFAVPPAPGSPIATLTGKVTDPGNTALAGVTVGIAGHDSGFPGDYAATTDASGTYTISGIFAGTYPYVSASEAGFTRQVRSTVALGSGTTTLDWQVARDWAAASGGGSVASFTGGDYTQDECGPQNIIDQSQHSGWGSDADLAADGTPSAATAKNVVIKLPSAVNVTQLAIDPSNSCSDDDPTSATGGYRVETSADGITWQQAAAGTFTPADLGKLVPLVPAGTTGQGVSYVRFWMLSTQAVTQKLGCPSTAYTGCLYMDSGEVEVFGTPTS